MLSIGIGERFQTSAGSLIQMTRLLRHPCLITVFALLCGCATVDFDYPKPVTNALTDTDDTYLGREIEGLAEQHPDEAGFYPLSDGIDALAARLLLAERAEQTLDAQYYLIKSDITGAAFVHALLRAADRGVRVRLLLDDIFTGGYDAGMAGLDSHPNFEIRIFNPFARRSARFMDGVTSFSRINRRMHNKSFTVDNQITLRRKGRCQIWRSGRYGHRARRQRCIKYVRQLLES